MAINPKYLNAYNAGYKQGMFAALEGSKARTIVKNDLLHIYGNMILALNHKGWKRPSIEKLIDLIVQYWTLEIEETNDAYDNGLPVERIQDKVERLTGIKVEQCVDKVIRIDEEATKNGQ